MIVNQTETGWEVIYQPAHALLSLQLAAQWQHDILPPFWWETLHAVAQHDNGWHEWERAPKLTAQGTPQNFVHMSPQDAVDQWERGVARGYGQHQWVGLLISRHATSLYGSRVGEVPALDAFLERHRAHQAAWMADLGVSDEQVAQGYTWVRFFDWLSLVLCWRRLTPDGKPLSLGMGPDGREYHARRTAEGAVTLDPYPFIKPDFTVTVEARALPHAAFDDLTAYQTLLVSLSPHTLTWRFVNEAAAHRGRRR
jgi:hypothetical protein